MAEKRQNGRPPNPAGHHIMKYPIQRDSRLDATCYFIANVTKRMISVLSTHLLIHTYVPYRSTR